MRYIVAHLVFDNTYVVAWWEHLEDHGEYVRPDFGPLESLADLHPQRN